MNRSWTAVFGVMPFLALSLSGAAFATETVNDVTQLNPISVDRVVAPKSVAEISGLLAKSSGPVCIGGGRYSMGGQIATEGCLFLDMRSMNRILNLDLQKKRITVEAGITWRKIQETIDPKDLSVRIMQSYSNFTVGGSLSVNVHGRYVGEGPLARSVESLKLILADGTVREASRTQNPELFFGAIGGYGGLGVIVEATLNLTDNIRVERLVESLPVEKYREFFFKEIRENKEVVFHNADLYPPAYKDVRAVTWGRTEKPVTIADRLAPQSSPTGLERFLLEWISDGFLGKQIRQYVYDPYLYSRPRVEWRNYEASYDVASLEPASREKSTYVLQEYFIPVGRFDEFVPRMRAIFQQHDVNVLNVSVRHALPDPGSLLAWAREEVFSFVVYYKQGVSEADRREVYAWTGELIDAAIDLGGTYYLPYQVVATPAQFAKAYPRAHDYIALKNRVDSQYRFRNKLWDRYYEALLPSRATASEAPAVPVKKKSP